MKMGARQLRIVFVPRHVHARMAIHSMVSLTGAAVAVRMGWGGAPLWADAVWYAGGFLGFHVALTPLVAAWFAISVRAERWVRGIVEEELIKFDMRGYEQQLQRILPALSRSSESDDA